MPLSDMAFPFLDPEDDVTRVWDEGQKYDIDENGNVLMPEGPVNPFWNTRGQFAQQPNLPTQPGQTAPAQSPAAANQGSQLPALDVEPGLKARQWEAKYTLDLAAEKRLREVMETVTQPQARMLIDQAIQAIKQQGFQNETGIYESQMKNTGMFPRWLPQQPNFQPGGWQQYQTGGMVAPPGAGMGATPPSMNDDQAAQSIWNARQDIQSTYRSEHPDWQPAQAIKDWWRFAPHEGASTLADYARLKGYLAA